MSSDYIKQLEEDNWSLKNRLEAIENRCEWLENVHLFRATSTWTMESSYQFGINEYKTFEITAGTAYNIPKDPIKAEIMEYVREDIMSPGIMWKNDITKGDAKHYYNAWKTSIISFVGFAKNILDDGKYKSIEKLSLSTKVYVGLIRLSDEGDKVPAFCEAMNDKTFRQGVTLTIRRGEKFPSCKTSIKKKIDGNDCNNKFMKFGEQVKVLNNIYDAVEKLRLSENDLEERRKREWDATH